MSKFSDTSRLEFILEMIEDIEYIVNDEGVDLALIDNILRYLIPELKVTIEELL